MNKIVSIVLKFVSILTTVSVSAALAAEREYIVPMEKSVWQNTSKEKYECTLSQKIPFYGVGKFTHKSGHKVTFDLFSDEPVMDDNVKIIVQSEPPPWRHDDTVFEISKFKFERGHNPLLVPSPYASRMLQQVENGMSPVIIYRDMADGRDIIAVMLSPVNFRDALKEYRDCEKTLLDFDLEQIKHLKLYFATNKDTLTTRSKRDLKNIPRYLKMDASILQIKVDAFADSRGRRRFNDNLSEKRSAAVVNYLLSLNIKKDMIYAVNHGEREPDHSNQTALGRSQNRRADVILLTTAPPTLVEQKQIEADRKAERRRRLTERSIYNQPASPGVEKKAEKDKAQASNKVEAKSQPAQQQQQADDNTQTEADPIENDFMDEEPPAPNFINFEHLVDKNNQKAKSK